MNKKAFTLIELLATIVILSIILSIVVINVSDYINDAKEKSYDTLIKSIKTSTELYIADYSNEFPELEVPGSTFDIQINDLVDNEYLTEDLIDKRTGTQIPLTTLIHVTVANKNKIDVEIDID